MSDPFWVDPKWGPSERTKTLVEDGKMLGQGCYVCLMILAIPLLPFWLCWLCYKKWGVSAGFGSVIALLLLIFVCKLAEDKKKQAAKPAKAVPVKTVPAKFHDWN